MVTTQHRTPNRAHPMPAPRITEDASSFAEALENIQRSIHGLGTAMAANSAPASPQLARSLQAAENAWRRIEAEFGMYSSLEVGGILGARKPNRNAASEKRSGGQVIGILRGNSYRYPGLQFDRNSGGILPVVPKLIAAARENGR